MEQAQWLSRAIEGMIAGALAGLLWGWIAHSRRTSRRGGPHQLVHPFSTLLVGLGSAGFFIAIAAGFHFFADDRPPPWATAMFLGFALLGVPLVMAFFLERHEVSSTGLAFRNFLGVRKSMRWDELYAVRYSGSMKWFRLQTRSGRVARVSVMLTGLPEFAQLVLRHAPGYAIDGPVREVLAATAAGRPPVMWG